MTNESEDLNLFSLANRDVPSATLLAALMADPMTARLLVAWRKSTHDRELADAETESRGEDTSPLDATGSISNSGDGP